jgi:HSP20 family protein
MAVRDIIPFRKKETEKALAPKTTFEDTFLGLQHEMNRLFDGFFDNFGLDLAPASLPGFTPRVDVRETKDAVEVTAELPGMEEKDIEVSLNDNELILRGEKKSELDETSGGVHRIERSYGTFYRRIPIPREVEDDKVDATFKNGVLHVKLPKAEKEKTKSVKIHVK